eukprot:PhM_4_TR14173/c3_g1_i3/m.47414
MIANTTTNTAAPDSTDSSSDAVDMAFSIFGLVGGALIAGGMVAQIITTLRTRQTRDFSWGWLAQYTVGLTLLFMYAVYGGLWPVYVPVSVEYMCLAVLSGMKIAQDKCGVWLPKDVTTTTATTPSSATDTSKQVGLATSSNEPFEDDPYESNNTNNALHQQQQGVPVALGMETVG